MKQFLVNCKNYTERKNIQKYLSRLGMMLFLTTFLNCRSSDQNQSKVESISKQISIKKVVGIGRIEPELKIVGLTSEVNGIIQSIHFQAGDTVQEEQIIAEMNHAIEQAQVEQAWARWNAQKSTIRSLQAALESAQIKRENARLTWERIKKLYEDGAENQVSYDNANATYQSALAEVKGLEADVSAAQNILRQLKANIDLTQGQLAQKMIIAPTQGQILSLDLTIGSAVTAGETIGDFAPTSPMTAWCEIDELFANKVTTGQSAYIRPEGLSDTLALGKVTFVGPYLREKSIFSDDVGTLEDRRIREVRIRIKPRTNILLGQRVECVIFINKKEDN